ncbi:MAG: hypothetical protein ACFB00_07695 [Parvularculaceae bacterium]
MKFLRRAALGAASIALAACATATPYVAASEGNGYGFSEQQIEANRYRVMFRGNSSTTREIVETFLLFRAAELTLLNGFDYFVVVEGDTEANRTLRTTSTGSAFVGGPAFFGGYGRGFRRRGFPYYAYGFGWGGAPFDSTTREITRYSAVAFIAMFEGEKPADDVAAFDARDVTDNLRPVVFSEPQS